MRLQNVFSGRPAYYDRNPIARTIVFISMIPLVPHGNTIRSTYTVPAGRKAMLESAYARVRRITVAGTNGTPLGEVKYNVGGATATRIASGGVGTNVALAENSGQVGTVGIMVATDTVTLETQDDSVTGDADYRLAGKIFEFDA